MNDGKIRLGVSSCLLGEKVRYDGGHKFNPYVAEVLGEYAEFIPVCPEVEVGLPTPRDTLRLVENEANQVRLVFAKSGEDITARMEAWARERVKQLAQRHLDGFVFKAKSPSSGMERIKLYDRNGVPRRTGVGVFARIFMETFPLLPVEDEGRLHDPRLRENFIAAIFTLQRFRSMLEEKRSLAGLIDFHTRHKLLILSRSEKIYRDMGRLVAAGKQQPCEVVLDEYRALLLKALKLKTTVKKQINVLQHVGGYFKRDLSPDEKRELHELIDNYRNGLVPLIVPITLLNHYVRKYGQSYLQRQVYLHPHPQELKLLNHV